MSSGDGALLTLAGAGLLYWALGVALCRVRLGRWYHPQRSGTYGDDRVRRDTAHAVGRDLQRAGAWYGTAAIVLLPLPDGFSLALALIGLALVTAVPALRGVVFARRRLGYYRAIDDAVARQHK